MLLVTMDLRWKSFSIKSCGRWSDIIEVKFPEKVSNSIEFRKILSISVLELFWQSCWLKDVRSKEMGSHNVIELWHCVKSVRIRSSSDPHFPAFWLNTERFCIRRSYSGPHFPAFWLRISPYSVRMRENAYQNNSEYGHFLRNVIYWCLLLHLRDLYWNHPSTYIFFLLSIYL